MSDHLKCRNPFRSLFIDSRLDVTFCCSGKFPIGNIKDTSLGEILTGPTASAIRAAQFSDKHHPYCGTCSNLIERGVRSQRTEIEPHDIPRMTPDYFTLEEIDIRWGNTCNLSCNYCLPYFSSKWASILGTSEFRSFGAELEDEIFSFIEQHANTITSIMLLGGEPFLLKKNEQLLTLLPNRDICLLTNLSIPIETNSIATKLMYEPFVKWGVSFENIGDKFEYVRHGASWEVVENNLKFLKDHNKKVNLFPLYCVYSAFDLVELYDSVIPTGYIDYIEWQLLTADELDVLNLSIELRKRAMDEIDLCAAKYPDAPGINTLLSIRSTLNESITNNVNKNIEFIKWTENLEKNQMKKEKPFAELWGNIYTKIKGDI
jgi:organic radical activating enzyme